MEMIIHILEFTNPEGQKVRVYTTMTPPELESIVIWMYQNGIEIICETIIETVAWMREQGLTTHLAITEERFEENKICNITEQLLKQKNYGAN